MKISSTGPLDARIMIVGDAPGPTELKDREPFGGTTKKLLRQFLMEVGIDPEEIYYTTVSKYPAPGGKLDRAFIGDGFPDERVIEGLIELEQEIASIRPNVILACGNYALWALTKKARWVNKMQKGERARGYTGIQDWRGSILPCTLVEGYKVIPTFHPFYISREGMSDHGTFKVDLMKLKEEAEFPGLRREKKTVLLADEQPKVLANYWDVVDKGEEAKWEYAEGWDRHTLKEWLLSRPDIPMTLDIEYIGSKLLCVGLTNDRDQAVVIPTETLGDLQYMESIVKAAKQFNAQNAMFDASILEWHYSLPIMERVTYDTMLAANAANIELPKGLDYLVSVYTRQPYYKSMVDWNLIKKGKQHPSVVYAYNGIDVWTQHAVMEEQIKHELSDPAVKKVFDFMMAMLTPLWNMSKRGIKMDLDALASVSTSLQQDAAMAHFELMSLVGAKEPVNVRSRKQVAELLYETLGLPVIKSTMTGPSCDDKTLAALQLKTDNGLQAKVITLIRQIRTAENLQSKFFDIEFDSDGRMRGHYDPTKTVTGRLASRKFYPTGLGTNQQNIPRDKRARRAFIADRGKVFGYADLEKAESLVVAHLTGDPRMLHDHSPGQNAHRNLGAELFNKEPGELTQDEYYLAKKTRHAGNYMQGWVTFQRNVNQDAHKTGVAISAKEAKYFIKRYKDLHPGLPRWWRAVEQTLWSTRTLRNLLGRRRVFYGHIRGILPEAVAFTPQSTVGDTLNIGFLNLEGVPCPYTEERGIFDPDIAAELREYGYESLQQIHDAVGFQVNEKDADKAIPLIRRALQVPILNPRTYEDFTIPVEVNVDLDPERVHQWKSNWGDADVYTKDLLAHVP